jgi:phosphatidylglycerophosphate synthase
MTAWRLPDAPLRSRALGAYAVAFAALMLAAVAARAAWGLSGAYLWKAAAIFGVIAGTGFGFVQASHPFARFGSANTVTTARAAMAALVAALVGEPGSVPQLLAASGSAVMTAFDGVDGYLARRTGMASAFGARFDMETDALLILALSMLTWQHGKAGPWIVFAGLLRYLFVVASWIVPRMQRPLPYSRRRQAVCVVQIAGLSLVVLPPVVPPLSVWLAAILLATLVYSFAVDIIWLCRRREPAFM